MKLFLSSQNSGQSTKKSQAPTHQRIPGSESRKKAVPQSTPKAGTHIAKSPAKVKVGLNFSRRWKPFG
ncbi:MAG: hypothetical protein P1U89_12320 [Verrucomicrobiales bacterium]|nr:hypothetical protein [Verrucomicrobiales bacterium]